MQAQLAEAEARGAAAGAGAKASGAVGAATARDSRMGARGYRDLDELCIYAPQGWALFLVPQSLCSWMSSYQKGSTCPTSRPGCSAATTATTSRP
eukprot:5272108-Pyramimonas_sp.AAC.1